MRRLPNPLPKKELESCDKIVKNIHLSSLKIDQGIQHAEKHLLVKSTKLWVETA